MFQSTAEKGAETRIERRESEKKQRDVISTFVFKKKKTPRPFFSYLETESINQFRCALSCLAAGRGRSLGTPTRSLR